MDYTIEREVIREGIMQVYAKIMRYTIRKNLKEDTDPVVILRQMVQALADDVIKTNDITKEQLDMFEAKMRFADEYIEEVIKANEE